VRKRIISTMPEIEVHDNVNWLQLDQIASIEITSEDPAHPIENALLLGAEKGWRANSAGEQTLRLMFDQPQRLTRILLRFVRTKSSALRSLYSGGPLTGRHFTSLSASSGTLARAVRFNRLKTIKLTSPASERSNWRLCRIGAAVRHERHLRNFDSLDD
jgi:hypothetical protein